MLAIERELCAAIYGLYALDCLHWLAPGEAALTRRLRGGWVLRRHTEESFTLLNRAPVLVNPLDPRPGWIKWSAEEARGINEAEGARRFALKAAPSLRLLTALAVLGALNLLAFLPALLITGSLELGWPFCVLLLAATHILLLMESYARSGAWRALDRAGFWREFLQLMLNPLAALRSGDVLLNGLYHSRLPESAEGMRKSAAPAPKKKLCPGGR